MDSTNKLQFVRFDATNSVVTNISSTSSINTGSFVMVTATFDNTIGSKLYVNGTQEASDSVITANNDPITTYMDVGKFLNTATDYFTGTIDEIGIWTIVTGKLHL